MSGNDSAGRIPKPVFLGVIIALFALASFSICLRVAIRLRYASGVSLDDAFILLAMGCLICGFAIMFKFLEDLYLVEALLTGDPDIVFPDGDFEMDLYDYGKWSIICMILLWSGICFVKFSFLSLFRKLIDRMHYMIIYWWVITIFTVLVWLYGISAFITPCPYFYSPQSMQCPYGPDFHRAVITSSVQMSVDMISDFLILVIPIRIIWKVQIQWTQKLALGLTLCLSIFLIAITLVRASGLVYLGVMDSSWEVFWNFVSTEVGVILTSLAAFRFLFVAQAPKAVGSSATALHTWYARGKHLLRRSLPSRRTTTGRGRTQESTDASDGAPDKQSFEELVQLPRAQMTGIHAFIDAAGRSHVGMSRLGMSPLDDEGDEVDDLWRPSHPTQPVQPTQPLQSPQHRPHRQHPQYQQQERQGIRLQHDISVTHGRAPPHVATMDRRF